MNTSTKVIKTAPKFNLRKFSKYISYDNSSKQLRKRFLDYFINDHNHNFVRSSPVMPVCDPSVAFVNAGMNQFKGIFLGTQKPQFLRVANSQKCVRVGGKHNDLSFVGTDGYHHTFFEMLGNWSFGDYFKKDACELAWKLLTEVYKIDPKTLYVTYFAGDKSLNLEPDLECKEIWENIGIPSDRILAFGIKDNFWEMGLTGPCGPCTEIHVDKRGSTNRAEFVNKGLPDLIELWNIVFIEFTRCPDGIQCLPQKHVDTGMGLERLCSLLQGKSSNYDTDLFVPIFKAIHKICKNIPEYGGKFGESDWNLLDTNYRILADHARMVTVCLADGMIPEQNQKLRRIMRKVFSISETNFNVESKLLKELSNYVVDKLGYAYPEMEKNIKLIHQIIDHEEDIYRSLRAKSAAEWNKIIEREPHLSSLDVIEMPGLVAAYKELKSADAKIISSQLGFKLFDTYGLDEETILKLSEKLDIQIDLEGLRDELQKAKVRSKENTLINSKSFSDKLEKAGIQPTDDSYKYGYEKKGNSYIFKPLNVKILKVIKNGILCDVAEPNEECCLVLNKTNLYAEAGGQASDKGLLKLDNGSFEIKKVQKDQKYILHEGIPKTNGSIVVNSKGILSINSEERLNNMKNHTAVHLLNSALKQVKGATCQKSSKVLPNYLNLDVAIFGPKLTMEDIQQIEDRINTVIKTKTDIKTCEINSQQLLNLNNVTLIPGEIYPEVGIRLIEVLTKDGFLSREPCCGTHVLNTADIEDFCIVNVSSLSRSTTSINAVTGAYARKARKNGDAVLETIANLQKGLNDNIDRPEILDLAILTMKQNLHFQVEDPTILPVTIKHTCLKKLSTLKKQVKDIAKESFKDFIEAEMKNAIQTNKKKTEKNNEYIIHYLRCSTMLDSVPLQKATRMCPNIPILVIAYSDGVIKARCCVPKNVKSEHFNAEKWLHSSVGSTFKSSISAPKGQDPSLVCNMKSRKVNIKDVESLLNKSLVSAEEFVEKYL